MIGNMPFPTFSMEPAVTLRVPRLARTPQDSQRSEILALEGLQSGSHQQPYRRRADPEMRHPMPLDHLPQPFRTGMIGSSFTDEKWGSIEPATYNFPRSHHPTDVREPPEEIVVTPDIKIKAQLLAHLSHASGVGVYGPLGFTSGAAGVDHQCRIHRSHHFGGGVP